MRKELKERLKNILRIALTVIVIGFVTVFMYLVLNYHTDNGKNLNSEKVNAEQTNSKYGKHISKETAENIAKEAIEKSERLKKLLNNKVNFVKISNSETKKETKKASNMFTNNEPFKVTEELKEVWVVKALLLEEENTDGTGFDVFVDYYTGEVVGGETEINCY